MKEDKPITKKKCLFCLGFMVFAAFALGWALVTIQDTQAIRSKEHLDLYTQFNCKIIENQESHNGIYAFQCDDKVRVSTKPFDFVTYPLYWRNVFNVPHLTKE